MKPKKFITGCVPLTVILLLLSVANNAQTSPEIFVADGKSTEWPAAKVEVNKDTKLAYAVSNDKNGINILIKSIDNAQQMKLMNAGMQILIDLNGKKNKKTGINYPLPGKNDRPQMDRNAQRPAQGETRSQDDIKKMKQIMLLSKKEIELFGFNDEANGVSDINFSPVKVGIGWDDNDNIVYELKIPYSVFSKPPAAGQKISIGIVLKALKMPEMGNGGPGGGGDMPGGGPGGPGGGGPPPGGFGGGRGGPGGGSRDDMQKMFQEDSFWIKYTLTT